jgi:hypothetical protein
LNFVCNDSCVLHLVVVCSPCALRLNLKGDPEWMKNANKEKVEFVMLTEMVDARGNVVKLKGKKKSEMTRKERMAYDKRKKMAEEMDDDWESAED